MVVLELSLLNSHPASGFPQAKVQPVPGEEGHSLCRGPAVQGQRRWGHWVSLCIGGRRSALTLPLGLAPCRLGRTRSGSGCSQEWNPQPCRGASVQTAAASEGLVPTSPGFPLGQGEPHLFLAYGSSMILWILLFFFGANQQIA